LIIKA
jgi:hypothetical protein